MTFGQRATIIMDSASSFRLKDITSLLKSCSRHLPIIHQGVQMPVRTHPVIVKTMDEFAIANRENRYDTSKVTTAQCNVNLILASLFAGSSQGKLNCQNNNNHSKINLSKGCSHFNRSHLSYHKHQWACPRYQWACLKYQWAYLRHQWACTRHQWAYTSH